MEHVRFPLLDKDFFLQHVNSEALLMEDFECMRLLFETVCYYRFGSQSLPASSGTMPRTSMKRTNRELPGTSQDNVQVIDLIIWNI